MKKAIILTIGLFTAFSAQAEKLTYTIDPTHSGVNFAVRHFVNDVNGSFGEFAGTITVDTSDMTQSTTNATIKAVSVDTNNDKRDGHLQEDDYFHVTQHPTLDFKSTKWEKAGENKYRVTGELTMLGVTKPVTLDVEYLGKTQGIGHYAGKEIIGFKGETEIKRSDWGLEAGGPIVGDDVKVTLSIQGHRDT